MANPLPRSPVQSNRICRFCFIWLFLVILAALKTTAFYKNEFIWPPANLGTLSDMVVQGNYAYISGSYGLGALDISDPAVPRWSSIPVDSAGGADAGPMAIAGRYVFVGGPELKIFDCVAPANPVLTAVGNGVLNVSKLLVDGTVVYAVSFNGTKWELVSFTLPSLTKRTAPIESYPNDIAIAGGKLVISRYAFDPGLRIYNLPDRYTPQLVSTSLVASATSAMVGRDRYAYVSETNEFKVLDFINPMAPFVAATIPLDSATQITLSGNRAYVVSGRGVHRINIENPADPIVEKTLTDRFGAFALAPNSRAVIATPYRAEVFDISSAGPEPAPLLGRIYSGITGRDIAVQGHYAVMSAQSTGLHVFDLETKQRIGGLDNGKSLVNMTWRGNYIYGVDEAAFRIFDLADLANPKLAGALNTGESYGLAIDGNRAFLTFFDGRLLAIDISDPTNPTELGELMTSTPHYTIAVTNNLALARTSSGLETFDVADPLNMTRKGGITIGATYDLKIIGDLAYVAAGFDGVRVIDFSNSIQPTLVRTILKNGDATLGLAFEPPQTLYGFQMQNYWLSKVTLPIPFANEPLRDSIHGLRPVGGIPVSDIEFRGNTGYAATSDGFIAVTLRSVNDSIIARARLNQNQITISTASFNPPTTLYTAPSPAGPWEPNLTPPTVSGDRYYTVPISETSRFFKLLQNGN